MKPSINWVLFGTEEVIAAPLALRAGPLEMALQGGKLWHIRVGDVEVWHGVSFTYRDADWGTPELVIQDLDCTSFDDGFRVRYSGCFAMSPVINVSAEIEGTSAGHVRFSGQAVAAGDIQTNRLGICLMHPMAVAGAAIEIEHTDGRLSRSTFPTLIPPWPPFMLIRALRHEYAHGSWARCVFAGDVFELEDQRNNSDASFKTYSRSNLMPRPYLLPAGVPIRQSVDLRLEPPWIKHPSSRPSQVFVSAGKELSVLPKIGIEILARDVDADDATHDALRTLRPSLLHLAIDVEGNAVNWEGIGTLMASAGARLRLDVTITDVARSSGALEALGAAMRKVGFLPESIAIFPSEQPSIDAARSAFPTSLIGGGTPHFFAQLNRLERLGAVDFVSFTTSPIVHGADDGQVMLSLQSLPSMIDTLRASDATLPIRIGPSGIAMRKSPLGGQPLTDGTRRIALAQQDPRCHGLYGAAWALGYIAQCVVSGVDAITIMSLSGPSGIVAHIDGNQMARYPTYFLLTQLQAPARACKVTVSDPSRIAALALSREGKEGLLLANLTGNAVDVVLEGWPASAYASILDANSWESFSSGVGGWHAAREASSSSRYRLAPYAIVNFEQSS